MASKGKPKGLKTPALATVLEAVITPAAAAGEAAAPPNAEPAATASESSTDAPFPAHLNAISELPPNATPDEKLAVLNHLVLSGAIGEEDFKKLYREHFWPLGATEEDADRQWQALQQKAAAQREADKQLAAQLQQAAGPGKVVPWDLLADPATAVNDVRRLRDAFQASVKEVRGASGKADPAPKLKDAIANDLGQRSGLGYGKANDFVKSWAYSSSDTQQASVALQAAAADKFGIEMTPYIKKQDAIMSQTKTGYQKLKAEAATVVDAMYQRTQQWFAERGITEITLFRGMRDTVGADPAPLQASATPLEVIAHLNPLNSWSGSYKTAFGFSGSKGYTLTARVPVSRVIGCCFTGAGCLNEQEFVVLGGAGQKVMGAYNGKVSYATLIGAADMDWSK